MQIRPATSADLPGLSEIDGTVESTRYLHVDHAATTSEEGGEARATFAFRIEERPARQKLIEPNRFDDDAAFTLKSIVTGAYEGTALLIEHDDQPVAMLLARPDPAVGTVKLLDLRVDYDYRRQGMGTALVYALIQQARESEPKIRAVAAETLSNNQPASALLAKCGFELSGVDTRRRSNHDLVKEAVTLFWYAALD